MGGIENTKGKNKGFSRRHKVGPEYFKACQKTQKGDEKRKDGAGLWKRNQSKLYRNYTLTGDSKTSKDTTLK